MGTPRTNDEVIELLGYDRRWLGFGLISEDLLRAQEKTYDSSGDHNVEHYQHAAFQDWFASRDAVSDQDLATFLDIVESLEPARIDTQMPLHVLAKYSGLSDSQLELLSHHRLFTSPSLAKQVRRTTLMRDLQPGRQSPAVFKACVESRDSWVHERLLTVQGLPREFLERLAVEGANRAIRNVASQRLGS